jgi:hypothetical protein
MKNTINRLGALLIAAGMGFYVGQLNRPPIVKAANASHILHVQVSGESGVIPGSASGIPSAISCPREGDCYVLVPGN